MGKAEGDFLYDTDEAMYDVELYTVLSEDQKPIPEILWVETEGEPCLAAEIKKPYSRKMLHVDRWDDYAVDVLLTLEAKSHSEWSKQFGTRPGYSKYFNKIDDGRWYHFKRNLYFFYYDIFG